MFINKIRDKQVLVDNVSSDEEKEICLIHVLEAMHRTKTINKDDYELLYKKFIYGYELMHVEVLNYIKGLKNNGKIILLFNKDIFEYKDKEITDLFFKSVVKFQMGEKND